MRPVHRYRDAFLLLTSTLTVMAGATIAPSLPGMEEAFGAQPHAKLLVQLVLTVPGLLIAIGAPVVGWILDRGRRRTVLIASMVAYGISGTSAVFMEGLVEILVGRMILGIAVAGLMVTCTTLVADYYAGPQRGHAMGLLAAFGGFGGVVFVALGSWLAEVDWRAPFLLYAAAFLLVPGVVAFIDEPTVDRSHERQNPVLEPRTARLFALCCGLACVEILALYMIPVHFPFFVRASALGGAREAGLAISAMLLVMAVVSGRYRVLQRRAGYPWLHAGGFSLVGLGFGCLAVSSSYVGAVAALLCIGVGFGVLRPNLVLWLMSRTPPEGRGRLLGGLTSCFFVGQFLCPLLTQPLVAAWGYRAVFLGTAIVVGTPALVFAISLRRLESLCPASEGDAAR